MVTGEGRGSVPDDMMGEQSGGTGYVGESEEELIERLSEAGLDGSDDGVDGVDDGYGGESVRAFVPGVGLEG